MTLPSLHFDQPYRLWNEVEELYDKGMPRGYSTGWDNVDELYTVEPRQWTVITGAPNSGKSEWLDHLMVNLAESQEYRFALFSPENQPYQIHLSKIIEKRTRLPFGQGPHPRASKEEVKEAVAWAHNYFAWIDGDETITLSDFVQKAYDFKKPSSKFGIVVDPWNYLYHETGNLTLAQYLERELGLVSRYCREADAHIWIVAHPHMIAKDRNGARPVVTPYDINGGAMWYNKADNIITVHRHYTDTPDIVDIHVQKVRFKHIGRVGVTSLKYDRVTGRYEQEAISSTRY